MSNFSITVSAPDDAIVPVVVLSVPSLVGPNSNIEIDFSSSTGHGGRPWLLNSSSITISNNDAIESLVLSSSLLSQLRRGSKLLVLSSSSLKKPAQYDIYLKLTNFLGSSSISSTTITIMNSNVPIVSIAGSTTRSITTSEKLLVYGKITTSTNSSSSSASSSSSVSIQWKVVADSVEQFRVVSLSKDKSIFSLPSYSLSPNTKYTIILVASDVVSLLEASSSIEVVVVSSPLVAIIRGPSSRIISIGDTLTVTAIDSYDPDINPTLRSSSSSSSSK
jgi:hypothetical protein